jgi:hypothetical protein
LETGGIFASERNPNPGLTGEKPFRFRPSHPFVHPGILSKTPIPLGHCQAAPPAGGGYPERKTFSFALTIAAGYVEMHKLMFSDAEIFC